MDEAVQCDRIAYIAYGKKLIDAATPDIPGQVGLKVRRVVADDLGVAAERLRTQPGIALVARFGDRLHVCSEDEAALDHAIAAVKDMPGLETEPLKAGLEESFIHLMSRTQDNFR
jgi:ABC-2 type transport system ATP-binding protein